MGYTIITPREHDLPGQAKRTGRVERNSKKFKKGLDKNKGLWYTLRVRSNEPNDKKEVMCMKNQMTYAVALNAAVACEALSQEVREKLAALLAQQEKKSGAEKKPTQKQKETAEVAQTLLNQLRENSNALTVSEMIAQLPVCEGMSNQKVSALVRSLGTAVERVEEKRKAYFRAV